MSNKVDYKKLKKAELIILYEQLLEENKKLNNIINGGHYVDRKLKLNEVENANPEVIEIYNHYLSKDIVKHNKLNQRITYSISRKLIKYTKDEILQSIDNYAQVYHDDNYYYNWKYGLDSFMDTKFERFTNDGDLWLRYLADNK